MPPLNLSVGIFLCLAVLLRGARSQGSHKQWSEWSPCSRTCGVGVSFQTRLCLDVTADGSGSECSPETRYRTCNIQDCPEGSGDFRYEQCARYNNRSLDGKKYKWVPYIPGEDRCGLNCMPKGKYFYYRWGDSVVDGTRCSQESYDICVAGKCQLLGCDLILNSKAKEDKCRVCNGNGENCRTLTGHYSDSGEGYKEFLIIPPGATNIRITETRSSGNFLAMADSEGKYFFNGNYVVTNPRTYKFAGTLFRYERSGDGKEVISALGPVNQQIHVVGLMASDDPNPGISYEFSVPKAVKELPKHAKYSWQALAYSACTASCAGGYQHRQAYCVRDRGNKVVSNIKCDPSQKPQTRKECNNVPCPARWFISGWSACSATCGQGQQVRRVHCEHVVKGGDTAMIPDSQCARAGSKPLTRRLCLLSRYCPVWQADKWSACSVTCGEGYITRRVSCRRVSSDTPDVILPAIRDDYCDASARPVDRERCNLGPCTTRWFTSAWSECFPKCGRGMSTRTVYCVSVTDINQKYPDTLCDNRTRPVNRKECLSKAICPPMWHASQWSRCTSTCGTGMKMRNVVCARDEGKVLRVMSRDQCDPEFTIPSLVKCSTRPCQAGWYIFPWQPCSKSCGIGLRRRAIKCFADSKEVPDEKWCDQETKPREVERCLARYCGQPSELPTFPVTTEEAITELTQTELPSTLAPPETRAPTEAPTARPTTIRDTEVPSTATPTTERPTTTQPTTLRPTTVQPTTTRPTTRKPTTTRPTTRKPTTARPTTERPTTTRPTTTQPTTIRQTTLKPTTVKPTTLRPTTRQPTTTRPTTTQPTTVRPTTEKPTTTALPTTEKPTTTRPTRAPTTAPRTTRKPILPPVTKPRPVVPARIVEGPRDITTYVRDEVLMTCRATGYPEPSVSWKKGAMPVSALGSRYQILEDGTLRIEQAMVQDEGIYSCYATNFRGPLQTKTANLRVVVSVSVRMSPRVKHEAKTGEPLTLNCQFSGKPPPFARWYKDRNSQAFFVNDGRISTSPNQISITNVIHSDAGLYECLAINDWGREQDYVQLTVKGELPSIAPTRKVCEDDPKMSCNLVVQVGYCTHSYYKEVCCKTCEKKPL